MIFLIYRPSWPANKGKAQLFTSSYQNGTQNQFHKLSKVAEQHTIAKAQEIPTTKTALHVNQALYNTCYQRNRNKKRTTIKIPLLANISYSTKILPQIEKS